MTENKFWWASGEEGNNPGPDPGPDVPINQSLRFRGKGNNLHRTQTAGNRRTFTYSVWFKKTNSGGDPSQGGAGWFELLAEAGQTNNRTDLRIEDDVMHTYNFNGGSQNMDVQTAAMYRDPSSWYHLVWSFDTTQATDTNRVRFFVNGVQQDVTGTFLGQNERTHFNEDTQLFMIGDLGPVVNTEARNQLNGYLADVYFIDGQALEPTAFGRFNDAEVWVPREVDFTPAEMRFSDFVTTADGGGWFQDRTPERMFDGGTSSTNETMVDGSTDAIVFTPQPAIEYTRLEAWTNMSNGAGTWFVNDSAESGGGITTQLATWQELDGSSGTLTELRLRSGSERANIAGIRITDANGTRILTNPYIWSADLTGTTGVNNPANAFDGNTATSATGNNADEALTFAPRNTITVTSEVAIFSGGAPGGTVTWNGTTVNQIQNDWTIVAGSGELSATSSLVFDTTGAASAPFLAAVRVDGQILIDGVNSSYGANGFHLDFADPDDIGADRSGNGNDFTPTGFDTAPVGIFSNDLTCAPGNFNAASPATTAFDGDDTTFAEGTNTGDVLTFAPVPGIAYNSLEIAVRNDDQLFSLNGGANTSIANNRTTPTFVEIDSTPGTLDTLVIEGAAGEPGSLWGIRINGTTVLVDNTGTDYDLMQDSPTQNYATVNPLTLDEPGRADIVNANLRVDSTSNGTWAALTTLINQEHFYFEVTMPVNNPSAAGTGTIVGVTRITQFPAEAGWADSSVYWVAQDVLNDFGTSTNNWAGTTYGTEGDVIGVEYDRANTRVRFWLNGTLEGTVTNAELDDGQFSPLIRHASSTAQSEYVYNFGQQPFVHRPAALGDDTELQTQNLPAATIANGRDHFQAITGPGTGVAAGTFPNQLNGGWARFLTAPGGFVASPNDQSAAFSDADVSSIAADPNVILTFEPDTPIAFTTHFRFASNHSAESPGEFSFNGGPWTAINHDFSGHTRADYATNGQTIATGPGQLESFRIRRLENADQPAIFWMQIDDDIMVDSGILPVAQQTFPNGLYLIKDRVNPNQWQWLNSDAGDTATITMPTPNGSQAYVPPPGNSVAYCWGMDDNGLNEAAGFQLIGPREGTDTQVALNHDLGAVPDMIIPFNLTATSGYEYASWFSSNNEGNTGNQNFIYLALSDAQRPGTASFYPAPPTETTFTLGDDTNVNASSNTYYYGLWTAIPGYSAFGSYTGNGSTDGPFIYTGFRPAFVMVKRATGGTGNWIMYDSTRDPVNVVANNLAANVTSNEDRDESWGFDFLSNGFKLRTSHQYFNTSGDSYAYVAFAENPFQAPVTAR